MLRELSEELGLHEKAVERGAPLAERSKDHLVGGREVRRVEKYFLTRVSAADVDLARASVTERLTWRGSGLLRGRCTQCRPIRSDITADGREGLAVAASATCRFASVSSSAMAGVGRAGWPTARGLAGLSARQTSRAEAVALGCRATSRKGS
jgi:hypothetical protein